VSIHRESNTAPSVFRCLMQRPLDYSVPQHSTFKYDQTTIWLWILMGFLPRQIFFVDLYHETLGPGFNVGSYTFPFGINFSLVSMWKPIFLVARDQASIPGVNRVLSSNKLWMFFVCIWKFSEKQNFFSWSFKTIIGSKNSRSHCLSRKCRTYTFNKFSLAKWDSQNASEGDLFGRAKIDTVKSCIQLLKIVLLYRGHLHKELYPGIFRYSKEWKSFAIDVVPKSA